MNLLVIKKKNIFAYKLFLALSISDFNLCDNCTPPPPLWKKSPPLSLQLPSKSWGPVKPLLFKIWFEAQPPPLPPCRKGGGAHYVTLTLTVAATMNFVWQLHTTYFQPTASDLFIGKSAHETFFNFLLKSSYLKKNIFTSFCLIFY